MEPLISVIVPVYNCEKYIERLINSILNQKYDNIELIVINDGSTDNSLKLLKNINNSKLVIIDKENTGVSNTRNVGLDVANGDLICFFDADDYIDNGFFQEVAKINIIAQDIDLINFGFYSNVEDRNLNTISVDEIKYIEKKYNNRNEIKNDFISLWDNTMLYNVWNKVYKLKIIKEKNIKFPNYDWGEDVYFNKMYLNEVNILYNSNKVFYHYIRERKGSITQKYNPKLFEIRKKEFKDFNDYFESWNIDKKEYYEYSCRRYIERIFGCIENIFCSNMKFSEMYNSIKKIINDPITCKAIKYILPKSRKVKLMLIPIKIKSTILTMIMGKTFNIVKNKFPGIFNKLKNRR